MRVLLAVAVAVAVALAACGHPSPRPAAPSFKRGVTVNHWVGSNYDEIHSYGGAWFDREDVAWIARHGFDHVRLRISMKDWLRADGTLDPAKLAPIDAAVEWATAEQVGLVLVATVYSVGDYAAEAPMDLAAEPIVTHAATIWELVARRYAAVGDQLRFELLHVPNPTTPASLDTYYARMLAAVRVATPTRFVYLTTANRELAGVKTLTLPADDRVGLSLEYFEPAAFSFQVDEAAPRVAFPDEAAGLTPKVIDAAFAALAADVATYAPGREVYVGQWGVYHTADDASARTYIAAVKAALDRHGFAWAIYDYESGCAIRGADGTPTAAYAGLGLGPAARETRYAFLELGERLPEDTAVVRTDGADVGVRYRLDEKKRRTSAMTFAADGLPAAYDSRSYEGDFDRDTYTVDESWRRAPGAPAAFYLPRQDDPLAAALVARWLVGHPGKALPLLPAGQATAEVVGTTTVDGVTVTQVAILGLELDPVTVWLDADHAPFAAFDNTGGYIVEDHVAAAPALAAAQAAALAARAEALARRLAHRPAKGLVVRHARVFDPETLAVTPDRAIVITGETITLVGANADVATPAGFEELDAAGRFVIPGLWDSHGHLFGRGRALLALAGGVTSVREMGNETDLPAQVKRYDAGVELGPHAVYAMRFGFAWATTMPQVKTEADARAIVELAAGKGYAQIKVLDDIDPALVPTLATLAHARGMRFSGHLPRAMTVDEFVAAGADEIQHVSALFRGQPIDARVFDAEIERRVALLAKEKVGLDPTLGQYDLAADGSGMSPTEAELAPRLPPRLRRRLEAEVFTPAEQPARKAAYAAYARAVKAAVDAGVTVLPGTDGYLPGPALHAELAAFVAAGVPPAHVLRLATLEAARTMKRDGRSGSIAAGKDADLVLLDGDPLADIDAVRSIYRVVKAGAVLDPAALHAAVHLRPARE
jgi:imidazolonepropionase-like amidohydrolase